MNNLRDYQTREYVRQVRSRTATVKPDHLYHHSDQTIQAFADDPSHAPMPDSLATTQSRQAWEDSYAPSRSRHIGSLALKSKQDAILCATLVGGFLALCYTIAPVIVLPLLKVGSMSLILLGLFHIIQSFFSR